LTKLDGILLDTVENTGSDVEERNENNRQIEPKIKRSRVTLIAIETRPGSLKIHMSMVSVKETV
jgi:hypothetical protein